MTFKLAPFHPVLRPILSEVFPHKLNYSFFRPADLQRRLLLARGRARSPVLFGARSFATSSGRDRMGLGAGRGMRAGSAKSLIEDEADLSDWVSGLNSTSFKKTRVYSDSDDDGGGKEGRGFKGGEGAGKRRRESEFDGRSDFPGRQRGGGRGRGRGRGGNEAFSGRRNNVSDSDGSSFGGRDGGRDSSEFRRVGKFGGPSDVNRRGGKFGGSDRRGGKFGGPSDVRRESNNVGFSRGNDGWREKRESRGGSEMGYRNGRGRGGNGGGLASNRGGRGMERRGLVVTDDDDEVEQEEDVKDGGYTSWGRGGGFPTNRGGRRMERRSSLITDDDDIEEDEDKGFTSFKELIDSDEEDDDSDEEDNDIEEDEDVRSDSEKERISSQFPQSSPQESASYLSESR